MSFYGRLHHVPRSPGDPSGRQLREHRHRRWLDDLESSGPTLERAADHEHLIRTFHQLKARGGHARGPDGVTYDDLGPTEVAILARQASEAILQGSYRPGPTRTQAIPKASGGTRLLTIGNMSDRVVAAAVTETLTSTFEAIFQPASYGFRPGKSTWHLLADLQATLAARPQLATLAIDDVRKAFDHVPIKPLNLIFEEAIPDRKLTRLIEVILRGGKDRNRSVGIPQGCPLAPLALNVVLHKIHDIPMGDHVVQPTWLRYADNLAYLVQDASEGNQILDHVRGLLAPAGLQLKGADGPPVDLRRGEAQLLGFRLRLRGERLQLRLGDEALGRLMQGLETALAAPEPPPVARAIVRGWIRSQGPAFESKREITRVVATICHVGRKLGYRELGSKQALKDLGTAAHGSWIALQQRAIEQRGKGHGSSATNRGGSACHHGENAVIGSPLEDAPVWPQEPWESPCPF